jgi:hypothetical protein
MEKSDEQSVHLALYSSRLEDEMHDHFLEYSFLNICFLALFDVDDNEAILVLNQSWYFRMY